MTPLYSHANIYAIDNMFLVLQLGARLYRAMKLATSNLGKYTWIIWITLAGEILAGEIF